jgi:hypothetical protein
MQQEEMLRKERDKLLMMLTPYEVAKYCDRPKLVRTLSGERDFVEVESMYAESDCGDDGVTTIASSMYEEVTVTTAEMVALEQQQRKTARGSVTAVAATTTTPKQTSLLEGFLSSPVRRQQARINTLLPNQTADNHKKYVTNTFSPSKTTPSPLLSSSSSVDDPKKNETIPLPSPHKKKTSSWSDRNRSPQQQQQHRGNEIWQLPSPHKNNRSSSVIRSAQPTKTKEEETSHPLRNEILHLPSPHKQKPPQNHLHNKWMLQKKCEMEPMQNDELENHQSIPNIELFDEDDDSTEEDDDEEEAQSPLLSVENENLWHDREQQVTTLSSTPLLDKKEPDHGAQQQQHQQQQQQQDEEWMNPINDELSRLRDELAQMQAESEYNDSSSSSNIHNNNKYEHDEEIPHDEIYNKKSFRTAEDENKEPIPDEDNNVEDELQRLRADLANMQDDGSHDDVDDGDDDKSEHPIVPKQDVVPQIDAQVMKQQSSDDPRSRAPDEQQRDEEDDSFYFDARQDQQAKTLQIIGKTKEAQNDDDEMQRLQAEIAKLQSQTGANALESGVPKTGKRSKCIPVRTTQPKACTGLDHDDSEILRLQEEIAKLESETLIPGLQNENTQEDTDDELHRLQAEIANMEAKIKGSKKKIVKKVIRRKKDNKKLEMEAKRLAEEIARMQSEIEKTSKSQFTADTTTVKSETKVSAPQLSNNVTLGNFQSNVDESFPVRATPSLDPSSTMYEHMLKIGLPEGAVRSAMVRDGVNDSKLLGNKLNQTVNAKVPIVDSVKTAIKRSSPSVAKHGPAELAKYHQMMKIGLPEGAVRQAMDRDGVDLALVDAFFESTPEDDVMPTSPNEQTSTILTNSDDPSLAKYYQMIKIGLPEGAVMNAIKRDGVDPSSIFVARSAEPSAKTKPSSASVIDIEQNRSEPRYSKYFTMLDIGLPDAAVRNAMERDQVDLSAVFGADCKPKQTLLQVAATEATNSSKIAMPPSMTNLLGAIEKAANKREKRLEENGGELFMQEIAPEVETRSVTPQLSTSMAEMIAQRAIARDKRLEAGGEKRMRKVVIQETEEYKKQFSSIVEDAAAMGRLTRLNEHTVEAVAQEKTPEQEWKSNGLLAIQWRSNHMAVIHDAARAGKEFKLPEHVVSNYQDQEHEGLDPDHSDPHQRKLSPRMRQLLEMDKTAGEGQKKVEKLLLGLKEERPKEDSLLIRPMQAYRSIEEVQLPRDAPPRIDPTKQAERMSKILQSGRPMMDISVGVAEKAWERRARLDRPGSLPKVKEKCDCPYCGNASPYQTFAYRELERKRKDEQAEWERKRLERARIREEKRRILQEAIAEDEAAAAAAAAAAEEASVKLAESTADEHESMPLVSTPNRSSIHAEVEPIVTTTTTRFLPKETTPSRIATCNNDVQNRIQQWNTHTISHPIHSSKSNKGSKYAQPNPSESGCRCVIM